MVVRLASTRIGWSPTVPPIKDRESMKGTRTVSWMPWSTQWMAKPTGSLKSGKFAKSSALPLPNPLSGTLGVTPDGAVHGVMVLQNGPLNGWND
jgi:hypothetical protein